MNDKELEKVSRDPRFAPLKRKNVSTTRSVKQLFEGVEQEIAFKDKRGRPWLKNPKAFARAQVAQKRARTGTSKSESSEEDSTEESDVSSLSASDEQDPFESIADLQDADFTELVKDAKTTESPTRRLALLHFDWDNTKAENIFMALESFLPARGHIERVTIYPSEFGMKRMAEETIKGPPELVDHHSDDEKCLDMDEEQEESSVASEDADNPLDVDDKSGWRTASISLKRRVRKYQIARLKYFYAIIEFDSKETAEAVYEACDGFEYESSGVRFDLRFVSDDEQFSVPSEYAHMVSECREINKAKYAPRPFETSALHSTRISVTWDQTPAERTCWLRDQFKPESDPKKTLTEDKDELEKYLALSSSGASTAASSDLEEEPPAPTVPRIHRHRPKKLPPAEIRAALLSALGEMPADEDKEENEDESAEEEEEEEVIDLNGGQNPEKNDLENEEYDLGPVEKKTSKEAMALKKKGKVSRRILPEALDDQADDSSNVSGEEGESVERKEKTKKKKQKQRQKMLAKKRKVQERNEKQMKLWPFPENKDSQVEEDSRFDSFLTDPAFRITQTHPEYKEAADFLRYMRIRKSKLMLNSSKEVADIGTMS
ncbi:unnamed protein product [Calicophoron daubneyi]|uniref:ESF1 RRM domain-containing protein n=1 Tax=Calicophoron daubneyi TaxID=300641 RepID=A0AAV2T259_CALDB